MTRKELQNRAKILKQQLQLMTQMKEDFLKHLSPSRLEARMNDILEELKEILDVLKEMDEDE